MRGWESKTGSCDITFLPIPAVHVFVRKENATDTTSSKLWRCFQFFFLFRFTVVSGDRGIRMHEIIQIMQIATFSQFSVYLNVTQAKQMTSWLLLNHFYPVMSYRRVQRRKKATNLLYTVRSLVVVRESSCQREGLIFNVYIEYITL